jgi:hypothetical protein
MKKEIDLLCHDEHQNKAPQPCDLDGVIQRTEKKKKTWENSYNECHESHEHGIEDGGVKDCGYKVGLAPEVNEQ